MTEVSEHTNLLEHGYGWRARIGFLSPGVVDESLSRQFYRMAPPGVTLVRTSLGVTKITTDEMHDAVARAESAARQLLPEKPDCIIIGGSPTVVVDGYGADDILIAKVTEATGIQASAAQTAAVEAFRLLGAERIAVATPFPAPFPELLKDFLEKSGFTVPAIDSLTVDYRSLTSTPLKAGYELGQRVFAESGGADVLYFPGAPFPIVDAIAPLEAELGCMVISSLQATMWKGLRMAGTTSPAIEGYGRLLSDFLSAKGAR